MRKIVQLMPLDANNLTRFGMFNLRMLRLASINRLVLMGAAICLSTNVIEYNSPLPSPFPWIVLAFVLLLSAYSTALLIVAITPDLPGGYTKYLAIVHSFWLGLTIGALFGPTFGPVAICVYVAAWLALGALERNTLIVAHHLYIKP